MMKYLLLLLGLVANPLVSEPREADLAKRDAQMVIGFDQRAAQGIMGFAGLEVFEPLAPGQREDLGFGGVRENFVLKGGHVSIHGTRVLYQTRPIVVIASVSSEGYATLAALKHENQTAASIVGRWFKPQGREFAFRVSDENGLQAYQATVEKSLGRIEPVAIPKQYESDYLSLIRPDYGQKYGRSCGYSGDDPAGRKAFVRLFELKNPVIYRNLLRGLNPAGRMYGLEGLARLYGNGKAIPAIDERTLFKLHELKLTYISCSGCFFEELLFPHPSEFRRYSF